MCEQTPSHLNLKDESPPRKELFLALYKAIVEGRIQEPDIERMAEAVGWSGWSNDIRSKLGYSHRPKPRVARPYSPLIPTAATSSDCETSKQTVNSSHSPNPSSKPKGKPLTQDQLMLAMSLPIPKQFGKVPIRTWTKVAPKDWPKEIQEVMRPRWLDKDGKPLPWDQSLCDEKGNLREPERLTE